MAVYLFGCDIGTTSAKGVLMDPEGNILGSHYVEYQMFKPRTGWFEHDPNDYWRVFKECLQAVIQAARVDTREIAGIGVSACSPCCILVDERGNALEHSQIWMDRRAVDECDHVRKLYGDDEIFKISANPLDPHSGAIKLLWEKNHRPELYRNTYKMLNPANFITMKLTGQFVTDYSNASLVGVFFDIVNRRWNMDMAEAIGLDPDKFTKLAPCSEVVGEVSRKAAEECGIAAGIPVVAGTVDCNAAWLGNGSTQDGDASLVMGTAGALGVVHSEPRFTRNLTTIIHTANSERMYTTLAGTSSCGALLRYLRDTFFSEKAEEMVRTGQDIYEEFNAIAGEIPPGADGLIVLPYLSGERTPLWNPVAKGMVFGLDFSHTRGHWVRAMMEGGIYAIYHCLKIMQENRLKINMPILISEGGAKSALWRQIAADVMDVRLNYMKEAKGAPTGDAINAGVGVGIFDSYDVAKSFITIDETHMPQKHVHEKYEKYYTLYRKLYEDVKGNYDILAAMKKDD